MKYWVITDTHFGHSQLELEEYCNRPKGFENKIFKNLSNHVEEEDLLIHLGDICWGDSLKWHGELNKATKAKKWLFLGNHDKKSIKWYLEHGWDFVAESAFLNIFGHNILFSHKPKKDIGYTINIHGHFHNNDHRKHEPELRAIKNAKHFLLAIEDTNYAPVNLGSIIGSFQKTQNNKKEALWLNRISRLFLRIIHQKKISPNAMRS